ncbi:MAG: protein-(glutamine-N5) methyltransferase, release factor-specific [Gallionellales bacterium RIFCSPLOWO2_12_FULL_59_22]|nr:MAG: protein-(glutamine-N5) methyltransferase, release factor-specific [Gallionellales bacterium RIFCSPLOWO2_02_FULL_59_110]OGT03750.1 MAG: protein-(glutamine-N5) methyltransferase, release factor-specific [Gallionellales bacterium RIFCSPLOWO2_02_58_13]OGT14250.1 MAG: protein-(glutamine-N5) methyltransferase, release factor-specific [Gallionellales bacterium RIFCSPLOWO2_12_FULL_59_22]
MPRPIQSILTQDKAALETSLGLDSGTARIEAQMLLQQALDVSRTYLLAHPEQVLGEAQAATYRALLQRRLAGEPLAYILGEREFYGLTFRVTPATLIPRPDTELLVELALQRISKEFSSPPPSNGTTSHSARPSKNNAQVAGYPTGRGRKFRILDLGTGSGAIALSIAHMRPDIEVTALDASPDALEVARENARRLNIGNARLLRSDWFSALAGERFDLIVSNPPYIANGDAHLAQGDLRFEPRAALASGADGLDDIRRIVVDSKEHLNPGGWLLFEHGYDQAERAHELLGAAGYAEVFSARDLAGIERVSGGRAC